MFERLTEAEASSYIIVLGPQCRNCSVVASVTNALCYIRQLSAPCHACCPSKLSCSSSRTARAAAGRSSQGGRPATTAAGGRRERTFTFPNRNVANLRLARKKERERCKRRLGNFWSKSPALARQYAPSSDFDCFGPETRASIILYTLQIDKQISVLENLCIFSMYFKDNG